MSQQNNSEDKEMLGSSKAGKRYFSKPDRWRACGQLSKGLKLGEGVSGHKSYLGQWKETRIWQIGTY